MSVSLPRIRFCKYLKITSISPQNYYSSDMMGTLSYLGGAVVSGATQLARYATKLATNTLKTPSGHPHNTLKTPS